MRILIGHKFLFLNGGSETYLFNQVSLLQELGFEIALFGTLKDPNQSYNCPIFSTPGMENTTPSSGNYFSQLHTAYKIVRNKQAMNDIEYALNEFQPDIVHLHSIYHHLSPALLNVISRRSIPIIMTLHDFKLICPAVFVMNGHDKPCMACEGKKFWHAFTGKCFKNSYLGSVSVCIESYISRFFDIYNKNVDLFISPSRFLRDKLEELNVIKKQIIQLPYFLKNDQFNQYAQLPKGPKYVIYIGRLSKEKGVIHLVNTFSKLKNIRLKIVGSGPLNETLQNIIQKDNLKHIEIIGFLNRKELQEILSKALFTIVPSVSFDNNPLAVYESFAVGKPVIGARGEGISELIEDSVTGLLYDSGNDEELRNRVVSLYSNPILIQRLGKRAHEVAKKKYSSTAHAQALNQIYIDVLNGNPVNRDLQSQPYLKKTNKAS